MEINEHTNPDAILTAEQIEAAKTTEQRATEVVAAATLSDHLAARVARIEQHLWPAPPDPTTPDDPTITDWEGVWPDGGLLRDGGIVWRNVSGVPLTTPPSGFPGEASQWGHLFVAVLTPEPEPTGPLPWVQPTGSHDAYQIDAEVTHAEQTWTSTVANNTWEPGVYGWVVKPA